MHLKKYKKYIQNIIAAVCVVYIIIFLVRNKQQLQIAFNLSPLFITILCILLILDLAVNGLRMKIVIEKCSNVRIPAGEWYKIFLLGRFLNTAIPQLGNIYRGVKLKQNYNISYTHYIGSLASFAWIEISINLIFALIIILLTNRQLQIAGLDAWLFLTALIILVIAGPIIADAVIRLFKVQNKTLVWIHSRLSLVFSTAVTSIKDSSYILSITATTLLAFIITTTMFHVCFLSINVPINITATMVFLAVLKIADVIVVTPGNIGVREIIFGIVTEQIGLSMIEGILASTILRVLGSLLIFIIGTSLGGIGILRQRSEYSAQIQLTKGDLK
jgi:uncharacterized membrane protein YbhN (UPF0104 family)